jgi:hypothetical protein
MSVNPVRLGAVALFLIAAALFASSFMMDAGEPMYGDVSTLFVPRAFLIVWMVIAVLIAVKAGGDEAASDTFADVAWRRLWTIIAVVAITAFAMIEIGFVFATLPAFIVFVSLFGYRRFAITVIVGAGFVLVLWFLFLEVFRLPLPISPWFGTL